MQIADTDSIIVTVAPIEWEPELGDYLGDSTNDIPDNDIDTFVTGGQTHYAGVLRLFHVSLFHTSCSSL